MNRLCNILIGFFIAGTLVHFAFSPLNLIKDVKLDGYYEVPKGLTFSVPSYFSREFQDSTDRYINYQFGLFPGLTRINHQVEYSLFGNIKAHDVHKGKNGYLMRYCIGCLLNRSMNSDTLDVYLTRYARLQDSLEATGRNIIWIIAPDKNLVFPECLPDEVRGDTSQLINGAYWDMKNAFLARKIDLLDFNALAHLEREKYPYEVISKGGAHWTQAYAGRCFDSLCNYLSANTTLSLRNDVVVSEAEIPWDPDFDIERSANLLFPLERGKYYAAKITPVVAAKDKKVLYIGDSFCHAWMWNHWMMQSFHPGSEFWYYNREVYNMNNEFLRIVDHSNMRAAIGKFDLIIIMYSAANSEQLDYGFMDDVYRPE